MRIVKEPTYKKYITKEKRFDDPNTAFSRGAADGNKYSRMHHNSLKNLKSIKPGKTIIYINLSEYLPNTTFSPSWLSTLINCWDTENR